MRGHGRILIAVILLLLTTAGRTFAQAPSITSISPSSSAVGASVAITGTNFGSTQGSGTISLNGTSAAVASWSNTSIVAVVPTGATSGPFSVTVNSQTAYSSSFTVTALPSGWSDGDVGSVGVAGSASYANGTFTVKGAGSAFWSTADGFHFAYQPLSGDGSIVARVLTMSSSGTTGGVEIRESLDAGAKSVFVGDNNSSVYMYYRTSTAGNTTQANFGAVTLPYWVKVVRSGTTISGYAGIDGVNWTQVGTSQTISMTQNVYIGLGASSGSYSALGTATFDSVSISSSAIAVPSISNISATSGSVGTQIGITGSNFGASQGSSVVTLAGLPVTINSWSSSAIIFTIPTGATSGLLVLFTGPSMNASNPISFTVTSQPLPTEWLDQDIGSVPSVGSATFSNGTFTLSGSGLLFYQGSADNFHFAYQPLSGDGSIIARVINVPTGVGSYDYAGVMIRETLTTGSKYASSVMDHAPLPVFVYRPTANTGSSYVSECCTLSFPYWLKLVRSGSTFSSYYSADGVIWTQNGTNQTISMAQNVYVGLAASSGSSSAGLTTVTFDSVSINTGTDPNPKITSLSATTGSVGSQFTINGSNFGASQGSSVVTLNGTSLTVNFWSSTSIVVTIPTGATSGNLLVSVNPDKNDSNPVYFTVTSQPLPVSWLDTDIGGEVGGSASYATGVFTVNGLGRLFPSPSTDQFHFVYQPMTGDGSVVARITNAQNGGSCCRAAGIMIRESLDAGSTYTSTSADTQANLSLLYRTSTGTSSTSSGTAAASFPYWIKVVRSGTALSGYRSSNGVTWTQIGSSQTITMAQNIYVGLGVGSGSSSGTTTATFDNVSITVGTTPYISGVSPSVGGVGTSVTIAGSNFGATQGSSTLTFNGAAATVTSWSNSQIVATVPSAVPSGTGPLVVTVNSIASVPAQSFAAIKPVITSLGPPAAPLGGSVIVSGSGFGSGSSASQVMFNNVAATATSWSDTSITVTVPSNATNGQVSVIEDGFSSNTASFNVIEGVSVSGITPTIGKLGTTVTINGAGFGPTQSDSVASFYGAPANIVSWSDTQIVTTVPVGTSTGNVSVAVAGNTAYGPVFTLTTALTLTDSLGNVTTFNAQVAGGTWHVTDSQGSGCSTCTQRGTIHSQFDSSGNLLSRTDENGNVTSYTYDSNGNVLTITLPAVGGSNPTTTYTYNSFNEVLTVTDPLGNVTTNVYDANGNLLSVTTPKPNSSTNASVTQFAYNSLGQMTQITDPLNHNTTLTYTSAGLVATVKDAQNNVTTYGYDTHGNRTSVTDALNHQTTFAYDTGDRLTTITYPDTTTTTFAYDTRGRRTSVTDQNGKVTTYAYDDADRLTSVTDAANHVTTYGYDSEDNLTSIKDANNNTTSFTPDAFGRITKTTFPSGSVETYGYDSVGNLTSKTDRKNQLISYVYDALNRRTQKSYPDTTTINYTYDLDSRLTQVTDPTGTYQFTFDNMGRLTATSTSYTFLTARNFTTGYSYDAASNRTGFTDPENGSTTYAYDTLNRLQTLTPPTAFSGTGSFGFSYDALSRRTQMTRPNNVATNYAYDNLSRLQSVLHQLAGSTIDGATYTVDNVGNRTAKTDQRAAVTSNYGYDAIYELTGVTQGTSTTETYTYDPVGNRLSSLAVSPYSVNVSNELTSTPSTSYTYDGNGNILTKTDSTGTTSYAWNFENRLTSVTLPGTGGNVVFKYDPFGRRIQKAFTTGANPPTTTTTNYLYDGNNSIEDVDPNGAVLARYSQGLTIDEPLAMLRGGATSYYHADGLGSVTSLSSSTGALTQTYSFDSFGKQTASSGSLTNPFHYTGREFDAESALYYMRARYFDPATGRFLSEDPVKFGGGSNFYRYAVNNPTDFDDPFGLCPPTRNQRLLMAARGLLNIGIGVGKVAVGVTVTAETGGLGAFFGSYEIVQGIVGNIGGGVAQLAGAATGNIEGGQTGADAAGAITSILGLGTLAYTKGNLCRATQAAQLEGLALTAFGAGMGELPRLPDKVDLGQNAYDVITGKGCGPTPSSGTCNGNCPK